MKEISVGIPRLSGCKIVSDVNVSRNLRKYFRSFKLFVNYDCDVKVDASILNIPLVSTVLPLAWLTGANVHVDKLDRTYVEAMDTIKREFMRMYPRAPFTTKIIVDDLVENKTGSHGTALLFTGGIDSTYSLITNINLRPRLLMFWGIQGYQMDPAYVKNDEMAKNIYSEFAERHGLALNFVKTSTYDLLNDIRIEHDFHDFIRESTLWVSLQQSLVLLGLAAPLSIGRFDHLLVSATLDRAHNYDDFPHSAQPCIDEKFAWADLKVTHDGYIHRLRKTRQIKGYLKNNDFRIRVCNLPPLGKLNCNKCEKCFRTIAALVLEGVDPNSCGFEVNRSTFNSMRFMLENKKVNPLSIEVFWRPFQKVIPYEIESDLYDSKQFFEWFRNYDINLLRKNRDLHRTVFNMLPFSMALIFEGLYYTARNRLHIFK